MDDIAPIGPPPHAPKDSTMNTTRTVSGTALFAPRTTPSAGAPRRKARLWSLALAGLLTGSILLGVDTLASVDGTPALAAAEVAQPRA
ncbi:MAG: hypothetical protein C0505_13870 [Leptothrix sp. (in: Bacteria)]|nr:hypothetical protein [Leptothrix sp. (in: b-proteobacteria)]